MSFEISLYFVMLGTRRSKSQSVISDAIGMPSGRIECEVHKHPKTPRLRIAESPLIQPFKTFALHHRPVIVRSG